MDKRKIQKEHIRQFIIDNLRAHPDDFVHFSTHELKLSRQTIWKYMKELENEGSVTVSGATKNRRYELNSLFSRGLVYLITENLAEDKIWREDISPLLHDLPKNIKDICQHGVTEIINNTTSHSEGESIVVFVEIFPDMIEIDILDDGIGIFKKIQNTLGLDEESYSLLELSKGKLTSDPHNHSGDGIFFTSRAFDSFTILSHDLYFDRSEGRAWLFEDTDEYRDGTSVFMDIGLNSPRTIKEVYAEYSTDPASLAFDRTSVPVSLARFGDEMLVSRSQARRLLTRLNRFKEIILDFAGIDQIGHAFADELFRVYPQAHPDIRLIPLDANEDITRMIKRVQNAS
jgi:anti-sigma regulatory factor (Ser/Thr protein kinase)